MSQGIEDVVALLEKLRDQRIDQLRSLERALLELRVLHPCSCRLRLRPGQQAPTIDAPIDLMVPPAVFRGAPAAKLPPDAAATILAEVPSDGAIDVKTIADKLGISWRSVSNSLRVAAKKGLVVRKGRGSYQRARIPHEPIAPQSVKNHKLVAWGKGFRCSKCFVEQDRAADFRGVKCEEEEVHE